VLSARLGSKVALDVTELKLPGGMDEAELRHVACLTRLERLSISGCYLSSNGVRYLAQLPELRELEIENTTLSEAGLARISELDQLEKLNLLGTHVSHEGLQNVCRMPQLKSLVIHLPRDASYGHLRHLSRLEYLRLAAGNTLGSGDLEFLSAMPRLRVFWLQCSVESDVLAALRHVPQLVELRLQANQLTDRDLQYFRNHTSLRHLTIESNSGNAVSDAGLTHLTRLTNLRFLNVSNCRSISDYGLSRLAHLRNLRTLRLARTSITDEGLAHLQGLAKLERLNLGGTGVTPQGLEHLRSLPSLRNLGLPSRLDPGTKFELQQRFPQTTLE
jgi:Leucine-rich repeat (LRR) protein